MPPLNFMRPELQCSACLLGTGHAREGGSGQACQDPFSATASVGAALMSVPQIPVQADARRDLPRLTAGTNNLSGIFACGFCEFFGFAQFPFGLIPKLLVSPGGTAIFVPDFPGANSNVLFIGFHQRQRPRFQFFNQFQYSPGRVPIVDHPGQIPVLSCFSQNTGDDTYRIHGDPPRDIRIEPPIWFSSLCRSAARSARAGWFRMSGSGGYY